MPSIAQEHWDRDRDAVFSSSKKRRWEEKDVSSVTSMKVNNLSSPKSSRDAQHLEYVLSQTHHHHTAPPTVTRLIKSAKRQRIERTHSSPFPLSAITTHAVNIHNPPGLATPSAEHLSEQTTSYFPHTQAARPQIPVEKKVKNLSPCHICHRRPTLKTELDSYADCEGCSERTCWICIRECAGYGLGGMDNNEEDRFDMRTSVGESEDVRMGVEKGHCGMVCSRCCVERGSVGEVWCLGCLRNEGAGMG